MHRAEAHFEARERRLREIEKRSGGNLRRLKTHCDWLLSYQLDSKLYREIAADVGLTG
jgi:hypothetical protein